MSLELILFLFLTLCIAAEASKCKVRKAFMLCFLLW